MGDLYVVATPIGNLGDITYRAVEILSSVDLVVCEDTRTTSVLFDKYEIKTKREKFNAHTEKAKIDKYLDLLESGKSIAIVSDAGTPSVSDPGMYLCKIVRENFGNDIKIIPVPGASALTSMLSVAHFSVDQFYFLGFLPHKKGRETAIKEIVARDVPTVLFESVHRVEKFLDSLAALDEDAEVLMGRELTKVFEQIESFKVKDWRSHLKDDKIKGEFSLIVKPSKIK